MNRFIPTDNIRSWTCEHLHDCAGSQPSYLSAENPTEQEGLGIWNSQQSWQLPEGRPCAILNH